MPRADETLRQVVVIDTSAVPPGWKRAGKHGPVRSTTGIVTPRRSAMRVPE